jgi:phosphoribosylformimino-5-aminoimidazole carboxamide ribotide isomerase
MIIYPAIDLRGGRCVRLNQGRADQETVYGEDPGEIALSYKEAGAEWIHVVDLDGAFSGEPKNGIAVEQILEAGLKVELGGGLRDSNTVEYLLSLGVERAVIGTRACESADFIKELVADYGDRIAVGIDAKDGMVAVKGWVEATDWSSVEFAKEMASLGVSTIIYTDIATDGMLTGPNLGAMEEMLISVDCRVIASGGVSRREDVENLKAMSRKYSTLDGVIVGKALYEKRVELSDLLQIAES